MSVYKDELRKALLFIDALVTDDTTASTRAMGYLAGVTDRLGMRVKLGHLTGKCVVCGNNDVELNSDGHLRSHLPRFERHAFGERKGNYCMGSNRAPRRAA